MPQPFPQSTFWLIVISIYAIMIVADVILGFFVTTKDTFVNLGVIALILQALYTLASLRIIGPEEIGARIFFGRPLNNLRSGLTFVPLFLFSLVRASKSVIHQEIPTDPEHIWRGDTALTQQQIDEGFRPPIRVTFRGKKGSNEPLEQELTSEVIPVVRWYIIDLCSFISRIVTIMRAKTQIEDVAVGFCTKQLVQKTLREAINTMHDLGKELQDEIEDLVHDWGVRVDRAFFKQLPLAHKLNIAIQRASLRIGVAKGVVAEAKGTKRKLILEGEGRGGAERAVLNGRAAGLRTMVDQLDLTSQQILGAEVARDIADHPGQTVIVGAEGFAGLVGVAAGISKTLASLSAKPVVATATVTASEPSDPEDESDSSAPPTPPTKPKRPKGPSTPPSTP